MLKIGLIGAGHLGKIHLKLIKEIPELELAGFYDIDPDVCKKIAETFEIKAFPSADELIREVDAVDIVTPTKAHFAYACKALEAGKHIFIEKPLTQTLDEAEELLDLLNERPDLIAQVGHVERFNPAFLSISDHPAEAHVYRRAQAGGL